MTVIFEGRAKSRALAIDKLYRHYGTPYIIPGDLSESFPLMVNDEIVYCKFEWVIEPQFISGLGLPDSTTMGKFRFVTIERRAS
jgi:hypothetical protein